MRKLIGLLLVLATIAVGCGSSHRSSPLTIGAVYPTTGSQGQGGREEQRGVRLAVQWANDHGGVHSRRVRLDTVDVGQAEEVPGALAQLRGRRISLVLGSHGSTLSAVAADVATRDHMLFWETGAVGAVGPGAGAGRSFFRLAPMGAGLGRAAVAFVRDQVGPRLPRRPVRYAIAYVDDAYGRAVSGGAAAELRRGGQVMAGAFPYDPHAADFPALVARVAAVRPDVLVVVAYIEDGVALRKATIAAHLPLLASIGTSSSYCMPAFGDRLGAGAVGLFASDKPDAADVRAATLRPQARAALAWASSRYGALYHEDMSAPALSGFADTYALLVDVLPAASALTPAAVARAALLVKLPTGSLANGSGLDLGPPGAVDAGENRRAVSVIWEWVAPRTRAVVWPPAYATRPLSVLPIEQ